ncbi:WAT1-related protein [Rhynchospora pubera]|uniref:WAT1-related protein n=1 Tax=Rhynchospora pubera TaxID=906938 RepID=A0AAV8GCD3_9POAL|nr:WAT1-related protein [Rhynchospora pubera]
MSNTKAYLIVLVIRFLYALGKVVAKAAFNQGLSVPVFVFYRHAIASILLGPVAFIIERKRAPQLSYKIAFKLFLHSLYGISIASNIFSIGLRYTSTTASSAICNLLPVMTFLLAAIFRMESLKWKRVHGVLKASGIALCIVGVVILAFYEGPVIKSINHYHLIHNPVPAKQTNGSKMRWILGIFLTTLSVFQWSLWTVLMGTMLEEYPSKILTATLQCIFTMIQSFFIALALERDYSKWKLKFDIGLLAVLYCAIALSGISYYLQAWAIQLQGPVFLGMSMPLTLIFTIVLSSIFLGEAISLGSVIGGVLMVGGLYNVLWGKRIEECPEKDTIKEQNHDEEANLEKDRKVQTEKSRM